VLRLAGRRGQPVLAIGLVIVLLALTGFPGRAQVLPTPARPAFKTGIELVVIDVSVLGRDGSPVEDLGIGDFAVTVDGAPRRIASVQFLRASASPEAGPPAPTATPPPPALDTAVPPAPGRTFIIVVDRETLPAGGGRSHLEAAARFVDTLGPSDRVGLWALPVASTSLRFLHDREQLKRELLNLVGTRPPGVAGGSDLAGPSIGTGAASFSSRCLTLTPEEAYRLEQLNDSLVRRTVIERECSKSCAPSTVRECTLAIELQARVQAAANEVALRALGHVLEAVASIPGTKHVLLITGGNYSPPVARDLARIAADARIHVHALQLWNPLEAMDVEVGGLGGASLPLFDQDGSTEASLASLTGGIVVTTLHGGAGFTRIARELAAWYVLAIEALPADRDGRPHRVRVEIVPAGRDLTVRARQQFVIRPGAPPPPAPAAAASADAPPPAEPAEPPPTAAAPTAEASSTRTAVPAKVTLEDLLARFAAEVGRFEQEFAGMVAEERYVQLVRPWRGMPKGPGDEKALEWVEHGVTPPASGPILARRQLTSDVLLVAVPGGRWVGYRDVAEVDGKAVRNRQERVRELFLSKAADRDEQLLRVAGESARYNLGSFTRTVNVPTIPLFLLHPRNHARFEFSLAKPEKVGSTSAAVVRYRERMRPTLLVRRHGQDAPIEGRLWLDPASGRVLQTELRFDPDRRGVIVTRYRQTEGEPVNVPEYMWEWYEGSEWEVDVGGGHVTECLARYSNYRRFRVETYEQVKP